MPLLELHTQLSIDQSSCQVVGHGVLLVAHVGHPVVGVYVVNAKEVEAVNANPDALQSKRCALLVLVGQVAQSDVGTTIGWGAEMLVF